MKHLKGVLIINGLPTCGKDVLVNMLSDELILARTTSVQRVHDITKKVFDYKEPIMKYIFFASNIVGDVILNYHAVGGAATASGMKQLLIYKDDIPTKDAVAFIKNTNADFVSIMIRERAEMIKLKKECDVLKIPTIVIFVKNPNIIVNADASNTAGDVEETEQLADMIVENPGDEEFKRLIPGIAARIEQICKLKKAAFEKHYPDEKVLCVLTDELNTLIYGDNDPCDNLLCQNNILNEPVLLNAEFIDRNFVETDLRWTQLISVILIKNSEGKFFSYERGTNELRLTGQRTICVGGHINENDNTMMEGILRETKEELGHVPPFTSLEYFGYVKDNTAPVSRLHLGIIFILTLGVGGIDDSLLDIEVSKNVKWINVFDMVSDEYESWSRLFGSNRLMHINT